MIDTLMKRLGVNVRIEGREGQTVFFIRIPTWLNIKNRHPENCEAPLDLGYCCTQASDNGFRPALLDLETGVISRGELVESVRRIKPAAVFFSGITPAVPVMLDAASRIRAVDPDCLITAVGQHADCSPETFLFPGSPFSLTTIGEFEVTVGEILKNLAAGQDVQVPGTCSLKDGQVHSNSHRGLCRNLDSLGMPDHRFFMSPRYRYLHPMQTPVRRRWGFIQASRGCPFSCIYCSKTLRTSFGPQIRNRSPESVVEEMKVLKSMGVTTVVFTDDLFNSTKERVMVLCNAILKSGVNMGWTAEGRVRPADLEMFSMMKKAGCSTFSMGVESGSPAMLRVLEKDVTVADAERAFAHARQAGLLRVAFFMTGCPGETRYDFEMTRALLRRIRPDMIQVANFTGYPGSRAYETYLRKKDLPWHRFQHYEELVNLSAEPDEVVRTWQKQLYMDLLKSGRFPLRYVSRQNLGLLLNLDHELSFARMAAKKLL